MRQKHRGREHFIRITEDEGLEVFHPEGCPLIEIMKEVEAYGCDIGMHVTEFGTDLHLNDLQSDVVYRAQFWAALNGDTGITLTRMQEAVEIPTEPTALSEQRLANIRRRLPDIPRGQMSIAEEDRFDLLAEVERLRAAGGALEAVQ